MDGKASGPGGIAARDSVGTEGPRGREPDGSGSAQEGGGRTATTEAQAQAQAPAPGTPRAAAPAYEKIEDAAKLQRLVNAKEKTRATLEAKAAWAGAEIGVDETA